MKKIDKFINMTETQLVSYALREHMDLSGVDKLIPTAEMALTRLPLTRHYKFMLRDAFIKIAEHHRSEEHYYEYVKSVRKILHLVPGNGKAVNDQIEGLNLLLGQL